MENRNKRQNTFTMYLLSSFLIVTLSLIGNIDSRGNATCSHNDSLDRDQNYYILSDNYPYNYTPGSSCSWRVISSDGPIKVICDIFNLPETTFCTEDVFIISDLPEVHRYCGNGKINFVSTSNDITVSYDASLKSTGGQFLCILSASKPEYQPSDCKCGWIDI